MPRPRDVPDRARIGQPGRHARQVLLRVPGEVEVERRDAGLHDAPHALAEVGHDPHQLQAREPLRRHRLLPVGGEQRAVLVVAEAVVDGEVAEVEVAVAHARVLPVDDPQAPAVVEEVGCEVVVVARDRAVLRPDQRGVDRGRGARERRVVGGDRDAVGGGGRVVGLDDREGVEDGRKTGFDGCPR